MKEWTEDVWGYTDSHCHLETETSATLVFFVMTWNSLTHGSVLYKTILASPQYSRDNPVEPVARREVARGQTTLQFRLLVHRLPRC